MIRAKKARELSDRIIPVKRKDLSPYITVAQIEIEKAIERGLKYAYIKVPGGTEYGQLISALNEYFKKYGYSVRLNPAINNYQLVLQW